MREFTIDDLRLPIRDEWTGCYPSNWKGKIVQEAMAHPAKYSSRLIHRIYQHIFEEGWVKPGDNVVDPFGGVALGALDAMRMGLKWYGVELEEKFVKLGIQNLELWVLKYGRMPHWGHACWVVKDYVKDRQIVPFTDQWRQLCEVVGFVTVHEHHALLVRNKRVQHTLDGGSVTLQAESKSFFRRLAESKGSPRIDWETVQCMVSDSRR